MDSIMMQLFVAAFLSVLPCLALAQTATAPTQGTETKVDVTFSGGHDTVGEDRGRPVVLIAAALNVPAQVFRDAFKNVKPAPAGEQPQEAQVRLNKQALMEALGPLGVTDDRLNEVSNYYRYRRSAGEMWRNTPAKAFATVQNGVVTGITITDAGSGYSSPPAVTIEGMANVSLTATLFFGTDLTKNGSIKEIKIGSSS
jgi:hypothetical protein